MLSTQVLVLYSESPAWKKEQFAPRECCVVDVGTDWLTVGVGLSWPAGLAPQAMR